MAVRRRSGNLGKIDDDEVSVVTLGCRFNKYSEYWLLTSIQCVRLCSLFVVLQFACAFAMPD